MCKDPPKAEFQTRCNSVEDCSGENIPVDVCPTKEVFEMHLLVDQISILVIYFNHLLNEAEWRNYQSSYQRMTCRLFDTQPFI